MDRRSAPTALMKSTIDLRAKADVWDGPHFRIFSCGVNNFVETPPPHAMFMDAMEPQGCWEYVLSGAIHYRVGTERYRVETGEALVTHRPDRGWMLRPVKGIPVRTLWLAVTGEQALQMFDYIHLKFGQIQRLNPNGPTVRMAKKLIRLVAAEPHRSAHFWSERTFMWLNTWWQESLENHHSLHHPQLEAIQPSRLISYAPQSVKRFAAEVGYSRAYLTRKLTRQWLRSPGKVLREVRMQDAARLLRTTRLNVSEIATKVGYITSAGFCRAFHRQYQQTPSAYRRSAE